MNLCTIRPKILIVNIITCNALKMCQNMWHAKPQRISFIWAISKRLNRPSYFFSRHLKLCRAAVWKRFSYCALMLMYRFDVTLFQYDSASLWRFWWAIPQNPLFFINYCDVFCNWDKTKQKSFGVKVFLTHPVLACENFHIITACIS